MSAVQVDPEREQRELELYLGDAYDHGLLQRYDETLEREVREIRDEHALYRTSEAYLYNLTAFAMTLTKLPYLRDLTELVPPPARLLDYGCGIGSDGLALIEAGYDVAFADFDNPSTRYLRWRLQHRGRKAPIHDLDREVPGGFDAAYAFDVIEHVDDPVAFLEQMESRARLVVVNLLEPIPGETALHHPLPIPELIARATSRRLRRYRRYYAGGSHLLLYDPRPASALGRLRSRGALWAGRLRRRHP